MGIGIKENQKNQGGSRLNKKQGNPEWVQEAQAKDVSATITNVANNANGALNTVTEEWLSNLHILRMELLDSMSDEEILNRLQKQEINFWYDSITYIVQTRAENKEIIDAIIQKYVVKDSVSRNIILLLVDIPNLDDNDLCKILLNRIPKSDLEIIKKIICHPWVGYDTIGQVFNILENYYNCRNIKFEDFIFYLDKMGERYEYQLFRIWMRTKEVIRWVFDENSAVNYTNNKRISTYLRNSDFLSSLHNNFTAEKFFELRDKLIAYYLDDKDIFYAMISSNFIDERMLKAFTRHKDLRYRLIAAQNAKDKDILRMLIDDEDRNVRLVIAEKWLFIEMLRNETDEEIMIKQLKRVWMWNINAILKEDNNLIWNILNRFKDSKKIREMLAEVVIRC